MNDSNNYLIRGFKVEIIWFEVPTNFIIQHNVTQPMMYIGIYVHWYFPFLCKAPTKHAGDSCTRRCSRRKHKLLTTATESGHGVVYPIDMWVVIGDWIHPEDILLFASICHGSHIVTHTARFWYSLYRRWVLCVCVCVCVCMNILYLKTLLFSYVWIQFFTIYNNNNNNIQNLYSALYNL